MCLILGGGIVGIVWDGMMSNIQRYWLILVLDNLMHFFVLYWFLSVFNNLSSHPARQTVATGEGRETCPDVGKEVPGS